MNRLLWRYAILAASVAIFVLVWWLVAGVVNSPSMVAGPASTLNEFTRLFSDPALTAQA